MTKRGFLALLIPYLTISTWYYLFSARILDHVLERLGATPQTSWLNVWLNFFVAFSFLVGSFFVDKVSKLRLIYAWAAIMPIGMILLVFASNPAFIFVLIFFLEALGSISLLAYCVYFCSLTVLEERGRVSGAIIFLSLLFLPVFLSLSTNFLSALIISVFLGVGTLIIQLLKPKEKASLTTKKSLSIAQSHNRRLFLLYMIPWLTFCAINVTLAEVVTNYLIRRFSETLFQARVIEYLAAGFGAFAGGVLADWAGRRVALSVGLISYGIGAALSGLASTSGVCILSAFVSGFSWGVLIVVYTLVIWGDFGSTKTFAPFYAAGFIPFYFSQGLVYLILPKIRHISAMYAALLSSFLIFLSNVPIILAKELLPQYIAKEMNLKLYIEWLKNFLNKEKTSESKKFKIKGRKTSQEKNIQEE